MKKCVGFFVLFLIILGVALFLYSSFSFLEIQTIEYVLEGKEITAIVTLNGNTKESNCSMLGREYPVENCVCKFVIPNEEVELVVSNRWTEKRFLLDPHKDEILDFTLSLDKVLLTVGERKTIILHTEEIGNPSGDSLFLSEDESVVTADGNVLLAVGAGEATVNVVVGGISKQIEVIVTDLLVKPTLNPAKESLKCGVYSEEQNRLLDEFLEYRVNQAGYKTRGAVVAVARFLTLEFPYKIDYFFENGRLHNNTGGPAADGEGRFYHKGLYLNSYKFGELDQSKIRWGPVTWGCPLLSWEDDGKYVYGNKYPNGLDCSGLVTWILFNAGFDPKDVGAGDTWYVDDDLGDFGPHIPITRELLESGRIKVGDIIGCNGHTALIGGLSSGKVFVVESTTYWDGVVMHEYTYDELLRMPFLNYVISMDHYYEEEGIYTDFWE